MNELEKYSRKIKLPITRGDSWFYPIGQGAWSTIGEAASSGTVQVYKNKQHQDMEALLIVRLELYVEILSGKFSWAKRHAGFATNDAAGDQKDLIKIQEWHYRRLKWPKDGVDKTRIYKQRADHLDEVLMNAQRASQDLVALPWEDKSPMPEVQTADLLYKLTRLSENF